MKISLLARVSLLAGMIGTLGAFEPCRALDRVVPRDYSTIGKALAAASPGDTVVVYGGIYSAASGEAFPLLLRDGVSIRGVGKYSTIVDAGGTGQSAFSLSLTGIPSGLTISRLQVRGGGGQGVDGGALSMNNVSSGTLVLSDCLLRKNTGARGGAVWASNASLRVENCELQGNLGRLYGGGICAEGAEATVTVVSGKLAENTSPLGNGGAAAAFNGARIRLEGVEIARNSARYAGGLFAEGELTLTTDAAGHGCIVRGNIGKNAIGGLQSVGVSTVNLDRAVFEFNEAPQAAAMRVAGSTFVLDRSSVSYHTSQGTILEFLSSSLTVSNFRVFRNTSSLSGILWLENSWGDFTCSTLAENNADASPYVGTLVINGAPNPPSQVLRIFNTIIADNLGMGVVERTLSSDPEFRYNLVHGNSRGFYTDEVFFVYTASTQFHTLLNNAPQSTGNLRSGSAAFARPGHDDFRIQASSDALNQALPLASPPTAAYDFDEKPRAGARAGTAPDIGAYESIAPHIQGPVLHFTRNNTSLVDDILLFQFDRPVRLAGVLDRNDFYLPVSGDYLPTSLSAEVDPANPTHLLVYFGSGNRLVVPGQFSMASLTSGSPSGIDLKVGSGTLKVVDAELGIPSQPSGSNPLANTTALDIGAVADPPVTVSFSPTQTSTLGVGFATYLNRTRLTIPSGALYYACTLKLSAPSIVRPSFSAVAFEIVSGSPVINPQKPVTLTLHYDPAEYAAQGYKEDDLTLFRMTEVAKDTFEYVALEDLSSNPINQNFANKTLTTQLQEIIPPRPVFLAGSEPYEGPFRAIYLVLPRTIQRGSEWIESAPTLPEHLSAQVHIAQPEEFSLSGALFPGFKVAGANQGVKITVRPPNFDREVTGNAPRPVRRTLSGVLGFEARQPLGLGGGKLDSLPYFSYNYLQLSDGMHTPLPSDFYSWDGTPVSGPQMKAYRYHPAVQTWQEYPPEDTLYDAETRVLTIRPRRILIQEEGLGLYAALGDPDAVALQEFNFSDHGWTSGNAAPTLPMAIPSYSDGLLKITAGGEQGYTFWGAKPGTFIPRRDRMFLLTYEVATDTPPAQMPGFHLRANSGNWQRMASYGVLGVTTLRAAPTPSTPKKYHVFMEPPGQSLEAAYNGNPNDATIRPYFDMIHFLPGKSTTAMLGLKSFQFQPFDMSALGPWTRRGSYDFAGTSTAAGWKIFGTAAALSRYRLVPGPTGLSFVGGLLYQFAGIANPQNITIQPGVLYRVRFTVRSNAEPAQVPSFRLRAGDWGFESFSSVVVESTGEGQESPAFKFRQYDVYYYPPQNLAALGTARLGCFFDYMNFNPADKVDATFVLESVLVDTAPWTP